MRKNLLKNLSLVLCVNILFSLDAYAERKCNHNEDHDYILQQEANCISAWKKENNKRHKEESELYDMAAIKNDQCKYVSNLTFPGRGTDPESVVKLGCSDPAENSDSEERVRKSYAADGNTELNTGKMAAGSSVTDSKVTSGGGGQVGGKEGVAASSSETKSCAGMSSREEIAKCINDDKTAFEVDKDKSLPIANFSSGAQKCLRAAAKVLEQDSISGFTSAAFSNGQTFNKEQAIDFVAVLAASATSKDTVTVPQVSAAVKKAISCNTLFAVIGENIEAGRDEEDAYIEPEKVTSIDSRITCKLTGLETLDFDECASLITAHNSSIIAKTANVAYQQFEAQEFGHNQQIKLMNIDPKANMTVAALQSQKDGIKKQKEMAEIRRTVEVARAATIMGFSVSIPKAKDYYESEELCKNPVNKMKDHIGFLNEELSSGSELCKDLMGGGSTKYAFFRNSKAKETGMMIGAEAGIDAAKEQMAVTQFNKQESMINRAIGKINGMEIATIPEGFFEQEDVYMQFCEVNPTHPDCQSGFAGSVSMPSFGDLNVGGFGENQAYQNQDNDDGITVSSAASEDDPNSAGIPTSTVVSKNKGSGGGLGGGFGSGAKVSEGGSLAQGAGGGGASPGGGGATGPSDAAGQAGGAGAQGLASTGSGGLKYRGGRGPSFVGGRGIASSKSKKKSGNPFSNMFKKKSNRSLSSLNFKGKSAIGGKKDDIFKRISSAYGKENNKGNLQKYEVKTIE